jgi:hypothetical protein
VGVVPSIARILLSVILLLIAAGCVYQAVAAREAPRSQWWAYWTIDAIIGIPCLLGAGWLLSSRRTHA